MKKFICILLSLVLTLGLSACGGKPSTMSEEMYEVGLSALKTTDDYMDNKIDYRTAYNKLDGLYNQMEHIYENGEKKESGLPVYFDDFSIQTDTLSIKIHLSGEHSGHSTYNELLEARNELAQLLGESKRKK